MAEPVVDRLELVAVDEHHRGTGGGALARAELLRDGVQERLRSGSPVSPSCSAWCSRSWACRRRLREVPQETATTNR
jgi:hypothetical protein